MVVSHRNCWLATGMVIASLVSVVKWQPGQMYGFHIVLTSLRSFEKFSLSSLTLSSSLSTAWAESSRSHSILPQQTANQLHLLPQSRGARTDELSGSCWENLQQVGLTLFPECNYSTSARACVCVSVPATPDQTVVVSCTVCTRFQESAGRTNTCLHSQ